MDDTSSAEAHDPSIEPTGRRQPEQSKRVALSSLMGTTIEWYEFFIYGLAASLVFDELFFPSFDPAVGKLLSLSTFTIAFIARPVGAAIFGHFGDRVGRKTLLVVTLCMMGGATALIGCLPTYDSVGVAAPVLLVALRFIQGVSLGGEYGGAILMSVEHAPAGRRGLLSSIVNTGSAFGLGLANLVFLALSTMPDDAFASYGWRIPFLLSGILALFGLWIRVSLAESPDFKEAVESEAIEKLPLKTVLTKHPARVLLMALAYLGIGTTFYVVTVFSISYGTDHADISESVILKATLTCTVFAVIAIPLFGWLTDRVGRRPIFLVGTLGMAILPWVWFPTFQTGNPVALYAGFLLIFTPYTAAYAALPAYFSLVFPTHVRYTGLAVGYTLGTVATSFAPIIATSLIGAEGDWQHIALYMTASSLISLAAAFILREQNTAAPTDAQPPQPEGVSTSN